MQSPKRTLVRGFRLDADVLPMLRTAAKRTGVSENSFVESLLLRRLKIDPLIPAFDHISLRRETFVAILEKSEVVRLESIGFGQGKKSFSLARELMESRGLELTFMQYMTDILGEQARWFKAEGALIKPERLTLHHKCGLKWSAFLRGFISGAYGVISHDKLQITATDEFVRVTLPRTSVR